MCTECRSPSVTPGAQGRWSGGFLQSEWRENMEECDTGSVSSTSSREERCMCKFHVRDGPKKQVRLVLDFDEQAWAWWEKEERASRLRFRGWAKALRWEQAWPSLAGLCDGHLYVLWSCAAECWAPFYKWLRNSSLSLVGCVVGSLDFWPCHMMTCMF